MLSYHRLFYLFTNDRIGPLQLDGTRSIAATIEPNLALADINPMQQAPSTK